MKKRYLVLIILIAFLISLSYFYPNYTVEKPKQIIILEEAPTPTPKITTIIIEKEIKPTFESKNIKILEAYNQDWYYHNGQMTALKYTGNFAQLYIPDIGINVQLIYINMSNVSAAEHAVDNIETAAYLMYGTSPVIADHNNQSFSTLKDCSIGMKAFIKYENSVEIYECIKVDIGRNDHRYIYDSDGNNAYEYDSNILSLYTCRDNWTNIYLIKF